MKKLLNLTTGLFFILLLLILMPFLKNTLLAANFSKVFIRLERTQVSLSTGGTVCAQTATSATESSVTVTFPTGFTVNSNASYWTVTTTNLPESGTAWPGIGTATSVSGQSVTFPSGNLSTGTLYCFNFSGSNTLTNPSTADSRSGVVTTKDSGGGTIDSTNLAIYTASSDQLSINAVVPSQATSFNISLTSDKGAGPFPPDTALVYTINYGSTSSTAADINIVARWTQGSVEGTGITNVDVLNYIVNSAGNAYGSTPPVIDLTNRTITWSINNFPANLTNQTVSFSLKTTSNYTENKDVNFSIAAKITTSSTTTPESIVHQKYNYYASTPSPSSSPASAPAATASPVPTAVVPVPKLLFNQVKLTSLTQSSAKFVVGNNLTSTLKVNYGTSLKELNQSIEYLDPSTTHEVYLENLTPATRYYFRIEAESGKQKITSDLFSFKTASISLLPHPDYQKLFLTSSNTFLNPAQLVDRQYYLVLPDSSVFEFQFPVENSKFVKGVTAYIQPANVLGVTDKGVQASINTQTDMMEIFPGVFSGRLRSPETPMLYEVLVKIEDYNGNFIEEKAFDLRIVRKFRVVDEKSKKGIEKAVVKLYIYNESDKVYEFLSSNAVGINNPQYTLLDGTLDKLVLPSGRYRSEITALGYKQKTVEFSLGLEENQVYPVVNLTPEPFNLMTVIKYYIEVFQDLVLSGIEYLKTTASSYRVFNLLVLANILTSSFLALMALYINTHLSLKLIVHRLMYLIFYHLSKSKGEKFLTGQVVNNTNKTPVPGAVVSLIDSSTNVQLSQTITSNSGQFIIKKLKEGTLSLLVSKNGYINKTEQLLTDPAEVKETVKVFLQQEEGVGEVVFGRLRVFLSLALEILFDIFITGLVVYNIYFVYLFKDLQSWIFVTVAVFNWLFWAAVIKRGLKLK